LSGFLEQAREAFQRRVWGDAYDRLVAADRETPLPGEDLERLAVAAHLTGRVLESDGHWARAHRAFLAEGSPDRSARCAFWLGIGLMERGETAQGAGWLMRARRTLAERGGECAEVGYLLLPDALRLLGEGDLESAAAAFEQAASIGERFRDHDLVALARHGEGRALIRAGRSAEGVALLDEAMVAVTAGECSPIVAGDVYCGVLSGCHELFDWRRAQEWTAALTRWCGEQRDLVPYHGQCLLRRAELMQLHGRWSEALVEARFACERLADPPGQQGLGAAFYQVAELHRLRGEPAEAEEAYRQASLHGRRPQPGLALLRLLQGDVAAALGAIRVAAEEATERRTRPRMLAALVEIALAAGELQAARSAAEDLASAAKELGAPYLHAIARQSVGAVLLAHGRAADALAPLREAERLWRELEAPYEGARARVLAARACLELGDEAGAQLELDAAAAALQAAGAAGDLDRIARLRQAPAASAQPPLTPREVEVLRLVAAGLTNRRIADRLGISEKTVARHVSNLFVKLGLASRSAATAYAFRHGLVAT
jgi:DNA-binding CsgD family transcriptional regulator/tetratricopeptide (TPR) repeat protein